MRLKEKYSNEISAGKRMHKRRVECKVKFKDYFSKYNQWILSSNLFILSGYEVSFTKMSSSYRLIVLSIIFSQQNSKFATPLPTPTELNGLWKVGFAEFIYSHTWYNINSSNNYLEFDLND